MVEHGTTRTFVRTPEMISSETPDAIVALDVQSGDCYAFAGPSARIWALLEDPISTDELVAKLVREFDIDEAACRGEVESYLAELEGEGVVKVADAGD